jgi:hypothetical protein
VGNGDEASWAAELDGSRLQDQPFTFAQPGIYVATGTVTDSQGNKFTANVVVQVYDRE